MKFGLLLPHFGSHVDTSRLVDGAAEAERLGFDSVWVRDHIVYSPHGFEDPDPTWLDPYVVLSAIAARTSRVALGTATLIPHRHPILSAQLLASLAALAGAERLLPAWGRGNDDREFVAVEGEVKRRGEVLEEQIAIIRALWSGEPVDHAGKFYSFDNVRIASPGLSSPLVHWYGGGSPRAIERTVRLFDGLLASRIPRSVLKSRVDYLRQLAGDGRVPTVGMITLVSPGTTGGSRIDVDSLVQETARRYRELEIRSQADLDGVLITGGPDQILEEVMAYGRTGVDHFVFDLRAHFDEWEACMGMIGEEVLPAAHPPGTRAPAQTPRSAAPSP
jgi:alkanesulfonate monooxygenase SsuD/methylene tetrahydromethanopterin reductase-like flavin-dependent oxidoreductase (luciferase family)